jgi:sRNA-binding regulator protein Hfq
MSDSSAFPIRKVFDVRQGKTKDNASALGGAGLPTVSPAGPRKLIRPRLPADAMARYAGRVSAPPLSRMSSVAAPAANTHAEAFYFQKQIHSQTPMIFVLDDGEQIEGTIDWYDLHSIKVKRGNLRTLIYKSGIKYLYKAAESSGVNGKL